MNAQCHKHQAKDGSVTSYTLYGCVTQQSLLHICKGCWILAPVVDTAAWEQAVAVIQDPTVVDTRVQAYKSDDPTADRRKNITAKLKEMRNEQEALREYLTERIKKRKLDRKTEEHLTTQLQQLADQEQKWMEEQTHDEDVYEQWKKLQGRVEELHQRCQEMREKLSDPLYTPSYDEKREMLAFLGITAIIWRRDHEPRFEIRANPPSIVSLLSV